MTPSIRNLRLEKLKRFYQENPLAYIKDVLGVSLWSKQEELVQKVVKYTKVMARASHSVGKSFLLGSLVNWHYDCFDPSITIATASSSNQVDQVIFAEVRSQRKDRPGLLPSASVLRSSANHFAVGLTANSSTAFHGRHAKGGHQLILFDEATGIKSEFWDAADGMLTGPDCHMLATLNPTDTASAAYNAEMSGEFEVIVISCMDHPNIALELEGKPPLIPGAVRLEWLESRLRAWTTPIAADKHTVMDVEWPPKSGNWYKPSPLFEGRVLGRYPTTGSNSVWSEAAWLEAIKPGRPVNYYKPLKIGCDVARYGDDYTSIVARRGSTVLYHETVNGWSLPRIAGLLKRIATDLTSLKAVGDGIPGNTAVGGEDPRTVDIFIDDTGVGGGLVDIGMEDGWKFVGINSAERAIDPDLYPNRRSELWFTVADRANRGELDLSRLPMETLKKMRGQCLAPTWKMDSNGCRVVERKEDTKKRIKRSPDDVDSLNLAFTTHVDVVFSETITTYAPPTLNAGTTLAPSITTVAGSHLEQPISDMKKTSLQLGSLPGNINNRRRW